MTTTYQQLIAQPVQQTQQVQAYQAPMVQQGLPEASMPSGLTQEQIMQLASQHQNLLYQQPTMQGYLQTVHGANIPQANQPLMVSPSVTYPTSYPTLNNGYQSTLNSQNLSNNSQKQVSLDELKGITTEVNERGYPTKRRLEFKYGDNYIELLNEAYVKLDAKHQDLVEKFNKQQELLVNVRATVEKAALMEKILETPEGLAQYHDWYFTERNPIPSRQTERINRLINDPNEFAKFVIYYFTNYHPVEAQTNRVNQSTGMPTQAIPQSPYQQSYNQLTGQQSNVQYVGNNNNLTGQGIQLDPRIDQQGLGNLVNQQQANQAIQRQQFPQPPLPSGNSTANSLVQSLANVPPEQRWLMYDNMVRNGQIQPKPMIAI